MKWWIVLLTVFGWSTAFAQHDQLKQAATLLNKALINKDTIQLNNLLHDQLTYGHSNGWIQTKQDVKQDMLSGKLIYTSILPTEGTWTVKKGLAILRNKATTTYLLNGTKGELSLHVLQVWTKTGKGWQLLSRQSVKVE